jgi:hypothetical protein
MTHTLLASAATAALLAASCSGGSGTTATGPSAVSESGTSAPTTTTPQAGCTRPVAPTNLRVTSQVKLEVELSWNAVAGATSYTVMVGGAPGGTETLFTDTTATSVRFTSKDGRQFARVQANNACGGGPSTGSIEYFIPF